MAGENSDSIADDRRRAPLHVDDGVLLERADREIQLFYRSRALDDRAPEALDLSSMLLFCAPTAQDSDHQELRSNKSIAKHLFNSHLIIGTQDMCLVNICNIINIERSSVRIEDYLGVKIPTKIRSCQPCPKMQIGTGFNISTYCY